MDDGIPEPLVPAWAHKITSRSLDGLEPLDRWLADAALLRAYQGSQLLFERIPGSRLKKNGEWKRQAAALIYSLSLRRVCVDHDARTLLAGDSYERIRAVIARALPGAEALLDDPELAPSLRLFESINRSAGLKKAPTGVNAMILLESVLVGLNSVGDDLARAMLGEPPASKDPRERQAAGGSVREDPRPSMDDSRVLYLTGDALGFVGEAQRGVDLCLVSTAIVKSPVVASESPHLGWFHEVFGERRPPWVLASRMR